MKSKNKSILFIMIIALFMVFSVDKVFAVEPITVSIENNPGKLYVGKVASLRPKFGPTNSSSSVTWKSSNTSIATVDKSGNVKGIKPGNVVITVTTKNNKTSSVSIQVIDPKGTDSKKVDSTFSIKSCPNFILVGSKGSMKLNKGKKVKFSSDDTSVLEVDNAGNLTAKGIGYANITATNSDGKKVSKKINVISLKFNESNIKITQGGSKTITVTLESSASFNPVLYAKIEWLRSSTNYMKINYKTTIGEGFDFKLVDNKTVKKDRNIFTYKATIKGLKREGNTTLFFKVSDDSSVASVKQTISTLSTSNDFTIQCPYISYSKDLKTFDISPYAKTKQIVVFYSYGTKTGSAAEGNWTMAHKTYTGNQRFQISIPNNVAQVKFLVYGADSNTSRSCYSIPLRYDKSEEENAKISFNNNIKCPSFTETTKPEGVAPVWEDLGAIHHSGYKTLNLKNSLEGADRTHHSKYQYNWFINYNNGGNVWTNKLITYNYSMNMPIGMSQNRDVRANLLTIDENGNVKKCFTDIYDNFNFVKKDVVDDVNVYYEKGYTWQKESKEFIDSLPDKYKIATKNIFYITPKSYSDHGYGGGSWTFATISSVRMLGETSEYYKYALVHELGHNLDGAYWYISGNNNSMVKQQDALNVFLEYRNKYKILTNNTYLKNPKDPNSKTKCPNKFLKKSDFKDDDQNHTKYYEWYYSCLEFNYLRHYSFDEDYPRSDFIADLVEYVYTDTIRNKTNEVKPVDQKLKDLNNKYLNKLWSKRNVILDVKKAMK